MFKKITGIVICVHVVFKDSDYENFYCYGCKKSWNIVNFLSYYKQISFSDAIKELGVDFEFNSNDRLKYICNSIEKTKDKDDSEIKDIIDNIYYNISLMGYFYMSEVGWDKNEFSILEGVYKKFDQLVASYNIDGIVKFYEIVVGDHSDSENCFYRRIEEYKKTKENFIKHLNNVAEKWENILWTISF